MDEIQEIALLRAELNKASYEYYVLDNPTMSDYDFDHKLRRLEELEQAHPDQITEDSPTRRVGGQVADGFQEVTHEVPLESLQDVFDLEELGDFVRRVQESLDGKAEFDVEPKVDGLSVALEYRDGLFVRAPPVAMAEWGGRDREPEDHSFSAPPPAGAHSSAYRPWRGLYVQEGL